MWLAALSSVKFGSLMWPHSKIKPHDEGTFLACMKTNTFNFQFCPYISGKMEVTEALVIGGRDSQID